MKQNPSILFHLMHKPLINSYLPITTIASVCAIVFSTLALQQAIASPIIASTLDTPPYGDMGYGAASVSAVSWFGQKFTVSAVQTPLTMGTATVYMQLIQSDPSQNIYGTNPAGNFQLSIYSDTSNAPGSLLTVLNGTGNPSGTGQYNFTSSGFTFQPSTTYWLVAKVTSGSGIYWWASADDGADDPIISHGGVGDGRFYNIDSGWDAADPEFPNPAVFAVTANPVPESSTFYLLGVSLFTALLLKSPRKLIILPAIGMLALSACTTTPDGGRRFGYWKWQENGPIGDVIQAPFALVAQPFGALNQATSGKSAEQIASECSVQGGSTPQQTTPQRQSSDNGSEAWHLAAQGNVVAANNAVKQGHGTQEDVTSGTAYYHSKQQSAAFGKAAISLLVSQMGGGSTADEQSEQDAQRADQQEAVREYQADEEHIQHGEDQEYNTH